MLPKLHTESRIKSSAICRVVCIVGYTFWCNKCYTACRVKGKTVEVGRRVPASIEEIQGEYSVQSHEARRGTVVRVREGHWKTDFAGMLGTVQKCWGQSEHAAVDVLMEDGRLELFWLPNLDAVDQDIAV